MAGLDPISAALDIGGKLIDRLWPDPQQRDAAKLELLKMQQSGELAQLTADTDIAKAQAAVNQQEASSPSLFVAGWRPFIGWACGAALVYSFILVPLGMWIGFVVGKPIPKPPVLDDHLWELMFGMLGLGGMRTMEKLKGLGK
jgi:hypothetical protein